MKSIAPLIMDLYCPEFPVDICILLSTDIQRQETDWINMPSTHTLCLENEIDTQNPLHK